MSEVERVPVLVVGGGPAGLTTAITLARHGVESMLIERRTSPSVLPKANVMSTRSMELVRSWGLEHAVLAGAVDVIWRLWVGHTLASPAEAILDVGLPSPEQAAVLSPTAPACVPQDHLEPVLLEHLRGLAPARVRLGTELLGLEQDSDGVTATVRDTGSVRRIRARYLVGADGAHSVARSLLGIPMSGPENLGDILSVLFRAPLAEVLSEVTGERRHGVYWVSHPEAPGNFVPVGVGDRWIYGLEWDPARERPSDYSEARLASMIRTASGLPELAPRIERVGAFTFAARIVDRYREGNAFLAGDAAHRVTPRGGTGMNTAIADGHNLGWKLAWVLLGWAEPTLLDSYERERMPVARHNVARSADPMGSRREVSGELAVDLGGRIPHVWVCEDERRRSTLDMIGTGWTAFTGPGGRGLDPGRARAPVTVRELDEISALVLGVPHGGALWVRPDGIPAPGPAPGRRTGAIRVRAHARATA